MAVPSTHAVSAVVVAILVYGSAAGLLSIAVVSTLRYRNVEQMRGRVMAVNSICFLGSSSIGGPGFGTIVEWTGVSGRVAVPLSATVAATVGALARTKRWLDWRV